MAVRRFRGGRGRSTRRESTWLFFGPFSSTVTVAGGTLVASLNAAALAARPFTVVRMRFAVLAKSDQTAAVERAAGAIGLAVVSDQATAIGVSAIPTPITDAGSQLWFMHQMLFSNLDAGDGTSLYTIDSKAMRKVEVGEDIVAVAESGAGVFGDGMEILWGGRILVKDH